MQYPQESTMKTSTLARAAALLLAAALGGAMAQTAPAPTPKVLSDAQPLPAEDRSSMGSMGAVVLEEAPVIAKREMVQETVARNRQLITTMMGAGPAQPPATADKDKKKKTEVPVK
jgi:hypothetical protein